jgi:hypothetical protein
MNAEIILELVHARLAMALIRQVNDVLWAAKMAIP